MIPRASAEALSQCLDAVRIETAALVAVGLLAVSADDLIGGATDVREWLADLDDAIRGTGSASVPLPSGRGGGLQQVVHTLSAVLVWSAELRDEGRLISRLTDDALAAWAAVEEAAGLPGRTATILGLRRPAHRILAMVGPSPAEPRFAQAV